MSTLAMPLAQSSLISRGLNSSLIHVLHELHEESSVGD